MSEELSERAKRILGDLGDGSPMGDLTAALDEVERLRAAIDGERAAVVAWLRGQAANAEIQANRGGQPEDWAAMDQCVAVADAIERGEHRAGEVKR